MIWPHRLWVERRPAAICLFSLVCMGAVTTEAAADLQQDSSSAAIAGEPPTKPPTVPLTSRLAAAGVGLGVPIMIRIFKTESELEVWAQKDKTYVHFATYPICNWSGSLGPKLREGDRQTPEGFYAISVNQLHSGARWPRSLDLGYPNVYDRVHGRTGSVILLHGGCQSRGCLAMTNSVSAELYALVSAALEATEIVPVHVFPFRMSEENLAAHPNEAWSDFWTDLKSGYDSFERTRLPPRITVCDNRYRAEDATSASDRAAQTISLCELDQIELGLRLAAGDSTAAVDFSDALPVGRRKKAEARPALNVKCDRARPSCKKWIALRMRKMEAGLPRAAP